MPYNAKFTYLWFSINNMHLWPGYNPPCYEKSPLFLSVTFSVFWKRSLRPGGADFSLSVMSPTDSTKTGGTASVQGVATASGTEVWLFGGTVNSESQPPFIFLIRFLNVKLNLN